MTIIQLKKKKRENSLDGTVEEIECGVQFSA
jgi:hypothetical protein